MTATETKMIRPVLADLDGRSTIRVDEAAPYLGVSRDSAYRAAHAGQIPTIRVGRRILVPVPAFLRMLGAE